MDADTTAIKKRRKKSNEHDNHSTSENTCLKKEISLVVKYSLGTYRLFAHPMNMITTVRRKTPTRKWRQTFKNLYVLKSSV